MLILFILNSEGFLLLKRREYRVRRDAQTLVQKGLIQKVLMCVLEPANANKFMQRDLAPLVQLIRMRLVQNDFKQQGLNTLALLLGLHFF